MKRFIAEDSAVRRPHSDEAQRSKKMKKRGEIQLTPEEQEKFLGEARKASLATIDKEGYPHVVAMNFIWRDGAILMSSYGKAQKVLNIRHNPKVGVMIEA